MDYEKEKELAEKYPLSSTDAFGLLERYVIEGISEEGVICRLYVKKDKYVRARIRNYKGKWLPANSLTFFTTTGYRWRKLTPKETKDFAYDIS